MKRKISFAILTVVLLLGLAPATYAQGTTPKPDAKKIVWLCSMADLMGVPIPNCEEALTKLIAGTVPTDPKLPVVPPAGPSTNSTTRPAYWDEDSSLNRKGADEDTLFPAVKSDRKQTQLTWFHARPAPGPSTGSCYLRVSGQNGEDVIAKGGQRTFFYTGPLDANGLIPLAEVHKLVKWWLTVLESPDDPGACSPVGSYTVTYQFPRMMVGTTSDGKNRPQ